jgi:phosphoribosylglycinamide formyltransferase-1
VIWRTTIMASGNGSNFESVVEASRTGRLPLDVTALVVNRADAFVRERARRAQVPEHVVVREKALRETYDARLLEIVEATTPDLVLLLGWMHVLDAEFLASFSEILNLHPAYLPLDPAADRVTLPDRSTQRVYRGPRAVDDALGDGAGWIGASVHRVERAVDRGAVIARAALQLRPGEPREELEARLHVLEREVVAEAIGRWNRGRSAARPR